ncbi:ribosomal protein L4/L1e [Thermocrinis albus DSM 14484]|uniref:Large ribosomal subunit protein uL4 n=1 Tax=Thermocrinis albus (strain DSM 14484 / JCM 11386 / HI 11/12) TaxID=638303 RepID=D3SQ14_THEAH|nr:50S ribosomal protein L4 [Thermocrinis albus]ADC89251.1 ribosomal protein L4/L1e [Thermocrinis albus DSM 14484]
MSDLQLREDIFGVEVKKHVLWEAVKWQLAARRQGTHSTKTRAEVNYSGRKILPQKGTGNARHGERGAPIFVGGGVAHGPKPRDYYYTLPKKVRKLALRMALSSKAKEGKVLLVDKVEIGEVPKTKKAVEFLKTHNVADQKVLLIVPQKDEVVIKSFRNIPTAKVLPVDGLNVYDILWADWLIIDKMALGKIYERLAP